MTTATAVPGRTPQEERDATEAVERYLRRELKRKRNTPEDWRALVVEGSLKRVVDPQLWQEIETRAALGK